MNLLQSFKDNIKKNNLFSPNERLLLAVSGGVDSVALVELCRQAGFDFVMAHCNFQLRGEESDRDEGFVKSLAKKYGSKLLVKKFETEKWAAEKKISIQEAARELRYDWFASLLKGIDWPVDFAPVQKLLTAHHADDNVETLLMNFCRGTGLNGLAGIPAKSPFANVCRPLLEFWKEDIKTFALANKLEYVEDSSNQSSKYTRNLFRNEIIPAIARAFPQVKENLNDNIGRFKEIRNLYDIAVKDLKKKICKIHDGELRIPIKQLMAYQSRALVFEIIQDFGFTEKQLDDVIRLTESSSGKFVQSPVSTARIIKFRNWLIISTKERENSETIIIEGPGNYRFQIGELEVIANSKKDFKPVNSAAIAFLDNKDIQFPLILRRWKQGDYFYPLGMKKKKKLARFFIDQKMSLSEKEKVWVIEDNQRIIWVVGHRIDERFKLTGDTKSILQISLTVQTQSG